MSTRIEKTSPSSTRSARSRRKREPSTSVKRGASSGSSEPEVVTSRRSRSKLNDLYASPEFQLSVDNDVAFQVATNVIRLRTFRNVSQGVIASRMGTSQSAVARIEGGDENITLTTLGRLVRALHGRLRFSVEPEELRFPKWPEWYELTNTPVDLRHSWAFAAAGSVLWGGTPAIAGVWLGLAVANESTTRIASEAPVTATLALPALR